MYRNLSHYRKILLNSNINIKDRSLGQSGLCFEYVGQSSGINYVIYISIYSDDHNYTDHICIWPNEYPNVGVSFKVVGSQLDIDLIEGLINDTDQVMAVFSRHIDTIAELEYTAVTSHHFLNLLLDELGLLESNEVVDMFQVRLNRLIRDALS